MVALVQDVPSFPLHFFLFVDELHNEDVFFFFSLFFFFLFFFFQLGLQTFSVKSAASHNHSQTGSGTFSLIGPADDVG